MRTLLIALAVVSLGPAAAQERSVPNDSSRLTLIGCARDRAFVVDIPASREMPDNGILPGRRFRMNGPRNVLGEIRKREATMVQITGLVKKSDLAGPGGVTMLGGRVRIGGAPPRDAMRDPMFNQVVIDVESSVSLPDPCPARD